MNKTEEMLSHRAITRDWTDLTKKAQARIISRFKSDWPRENQRKETKRTLLESPLAVEVLALKEEDGEVGAVRSSKPR